MPARTASTGREEQAGANPRLPDAVLVSTRPTHVPTATGQGGRGTRCHRPPIFHIPPFDGSDLRIPIGAIGAQQHRRNHIHWAHRLTGRCRSCKPAIRVQFPVGPLSYPIAEPVPWSNGDDIWLTTRKRWFDSIRDHLSDGFPSRHWRGAMLVLQRGFQSRQHGFDSRPRHLE